MVRYALVCLVALTATSALAQTPPPEPSPEPSSPPAAAAPGPAAPARRAGKAVPGGKKDACRDKGNGLRGIERVDAVQLCMAEARLDCVKQAIGEKIPPRDRKDYLKKCLGVAE